MGFATAMAIIGTGISAFQGIRAFQAGQDQDRQMEKVLDFNEQMARLQVEDIQNQGQTEAAQYQGQVRKVIGKQRAAYAAQGVEVDSGSAAMTQEDTTNVAQMDVEQIKSNAWRSAWGAKVDAYNASMQGELQRQAIRNQATSSLLTGGLGALNYGMKMFEYNSSAGTGGKR